MSDRTPKKRSSGLSYWPEFAYLEWPSSVERPTQEQVLGHAFALLGRDRTNEVDRYEVKVSRVTLKPVIVMAAMPVLIQVCGLSAKHAARLLCTGRHVLSRKAPAGFLTCPAAKTLSLTLLCSLVDEQKHKQRQGGRS